MITELIQKKFQEKVLGEFGLLKEGEDRFRVLNPFHFDDGDHFSVVLKKESDFWILSDEGDTIFRMLEKINEKDLREGTRGRIFQNTLFMFNVCERNGELIVPIENDGYGEALYRLFQALIKLSDITYLSRDRVRSTFVDDFKKLISSHIPQERYSFDWVDNERDDNRLYKVDCRVNSMAKPLMIFALPNEDKVRDATITLQKFNEWKVKFSSLAIFQDQTDINRKVLARFTDYCDKQYSSMDTDEKRDSIVEYINGVINN